MARWLGREYVVGCVGRSGRLARWDCIHSCSIRWADDVAETGGRCGICLDPGGDRVCAGPGTSRTGSGGGRTCCSWPMTSSRAATPAPRATGRRPSTWPREFERAGLKPAGTEGYFQPVRLISREIDEAHSSLALVRDSGKEEPLALGTDAIISLAGRAGPGAGGRDGLRRPRPVDPRGASRRLRRPGRPRQAGGRPGRRAAIDPRAAGRAHPVAPPSAPRS